MTIYIDMYDVLKEFKPDEWGTPDERVWPENKVAAYLIAIPPADVQPVRRGEWVDPRPDSEMCSCCGTRFYISALFAVGGNDEPNYCPYCGAKMKEDEG